MAHEQDVERALRAIQNERDAQQSHVRALEERDDLVVKALASAPEHMSDNELARQLGISPSTFRSITAEFRKKRRTGKR